MNSWEIAKAQKALTQAGIDPDIIPRNEVPIIDVEALGGYVDESPAILKDWSGDKFYGGFGVTKLLQMDYWTLRARSGQMFVENIYARGIISRLVTNEINTGLELEATPDEFILGVEQDGLADWAEQVENRYHLFGKNPRRCDVQERLTMGGLQRAIRMESLISGDVLVVLVQDPNTKLPRVKLVSGSLVRTPAGKMLDSDVIHGVQVDADGRHLGFWITQANGTSKYLPAFGGVSGRRVAWLVYGTQNRLDAVRGEPLLSIILQSLKEVDRYRDAAQRKAVINSMLAMFIEKTQDKMGTSPITGGAARKGQLTVVEDRKGRKFNMASMIPGVVIEELQHGEKPVPGSNAGTDVNFGTFEEVIVQGMSWCLQIPPEILRLSFSNNYSASQAAINEFKIYLNLVRTAFGEGFCQPHYVEYLISEALVGGVQAPGLLQAWRTPKMHNIFSAWIASDWAGAIKPSTDILKQAKGYKELVGEGWITNDRASRELTGTKFSKNIKRVAAENVLKVAAARPIAEFKKEFGDVIASEALGQVTVSASNLAQDAADIVLDTLEAQA